MGKKVNQTELAETIGVTDVTLWSWQKEGMPVEERNTRGQSNVYDTAEVIRWWLDREVKKVRQESARDELARAQTELVKIQIQEKNGKLVPVDEAERKYTQMVIRSRQRVLQVPSTLPVDDATKTLIDTELRAALMELSQDEHSGAGLDDQGEPALGPTDQADGGEVGDDAALHERQVAIPGAVQAVGDAVSGGGA